MFYDFYKKTPLGPEYYGTHEFETPAGAQLYAEVLNLTYLDLKGGEKSNA